jgi:hypothetical protein
MGGRGAQQKPYKIAGMLSFVIRFYKVGGTYRD